MQIRRVLSDCPTPEALIDARKQQTLVSLKLFSEEERLTVEIHSHEQPQDNLFIFTGRIPDLGTAFELTCLNYGKGTSGILEFDDDLPDPALELAEAYPEL